MSDQAGSARPPELEIGNIFKANIGAFGKYQLYLCLIVFVSKFSVAFHQMTVIFISPKTNFVCLDNNMETPGKCPCSNITYNTQIFTKTIITEWDLICGRRWMTGFAQVFVMLGILVGSFVFGAISDRYGRRPPLIWGAIIQIVCGVIASQVPEYWTFIFFRFLVGCATGGLMVVGYVLIMEFVGKEHREVISALYQLPLNIGHMLLPLFAYFIRDFHWLLLAVTLPSTIMLCYYWILPESPRWLLAVGETEKAIKIMEKVAIINKMPHENIAQILNQYQKNKTKDDLKKGNVLDLMKTPNIRKNTIGMSVAWLVCGFGYYGLTHLTGTLSGNIFINVTISAFATIPATLLSIPLMRVLGRKSLLLWSFFITSISLIIMAVIPKIDMVKVALAVIGVSFIFIAFIVVYLYASEVFPTVLRNAGVGLVSTVSRIGSMAAPYVIDLETSLDWIQPAIFGIVPLVGMILVLPLPETKGYVLPTTIEDGENFGKKQKPPEPTTSNPPNKEPK